MPEGGHLPADVADGEIGSAAKGGSSVGDKPICLLDEIGKLFKRVIAARLEAHISGRVPEWHDSQYGFRRGRSAVDAVKRVRSMAEDLVSRYGTAVAVSLDVSNAFNSIPWARIMEALRHFEVRSYLVEVIGAYLNDR
jgi:hypothetical protein